MVSIVQGLVHQQEHIYHYMLHLMPLRNDIDSLIWKERNVVGGNSHMQ